MKRYLLFGGMRYYPSGGWEDFVNSFDSIDEAVKVGTEYKTRHGYEIGNGKPMTIKYWDHEWFMIVDRETGEIIKNEINETFKD